MSIFLGFFLPSPEFFTRARLLRFLVKRDCLGFVRYERASRGLVFLSC